MKLISAKYHNFMSFGETENELNFEEVFADGETLLVVGIRDGDPQRSNGAGKSSVVEGLPLCLVRQTSADRGTASGTEGRSRQGDHQDRRCRRIRRR